MQGWWCMHTYVYMGDRRHKNEISALSEWWIVHVCVVVVVYTYGTNPPPSPTNNQKTLPSTNPPPLPSALGGLWLSSHRPRL